MLSHPAGATAGQRVAGEYFPAASSASVARRAPHASAAGRRPDPESAGRGSIIVCRRCSPVQRRASVSCLLYVDFSAYGDVDERRRVRRYCSGREMTRPPTVARAAVAAVCVVGLTACSAHEGATARYSAAPVTRPSSGHSSTVPGRHGPATSELPWAGVAVGGPARHAVPLLTADGSVFAADQATLFRLTPHGTVAARASVHDVAAASAGFTGPAVIDGVLWLPPGGRRPRLRALDARTLRPVASVAVPVTRSGDSPLPLAGSRSDDRLFAAAGHSLLVVDARTKRVVGRYPVSGGAISAVAVSPDGSWIYLGIVVNELTGRVETLNAATGARLGEGVPGEPYRRADRVVRRRLGAQQLGHGRFGRLHRRC